MAYKFYEFHYAETDGFQIKNLGVLIYYSNKSITKENLKAYARQYLNNPAANIMISHITKLNKSEFEKLTGKKVE